MLTREQIGDMQRNRIGSPGQVLEVHVDLLANECLRLLALLARKNDALIKLSSDDGWIDSEEACSEFARTEAAATEPE